MVHQAIAASGSKWVHSGAKWRKYYPSHLEVSCRENSFVDVRGQRSAWAQCWETTRKATGSPRSTDHKQTDHSCVIKCTHKINPLRMMPLRLTTQPPSPSYSPEEHPEPCATCRGQSPGTRFRLSIQLLSKWIVASNEVICQEWPSAAEPTHTATRQTL